VKLRQQPVSEKFAGYIACIGNGKGGGIGFTDTQNEKEWLKPDIDLGQAYQPDEEHELVFAVHGNHLIFSMDGKLVARVQDARFQKGKIELATLMDQANDPNPTRIRKVEYMPLDGLSEVEALKAAGIEGRADGPPSAANGSGATSTPQTALGGPSALPVPLPQPGPDGRMIFPVGVWAQMKDLTKHEKTEDGPWVRLGQVVNGWYEKDVVLMTNLGIRARFRGQRVKDYDYPQLNLRGVKDKTPALNLHIRSGKMQIRVMDAGFPVLAEAPLREPLPAGKEYVAEFYAIGQQVIARVNGQVLTATRKLPPAPGNFSLFGADWDYVQDAQVLNLDGLSEAEALKAAGVEP